MTKNVVLYDRAQVRALSETLHLINCAYNLTSYIPLPVEKISSLRHYSTAQTLAVHRSLELEL